MGSPPRDERSDPGERPGSPPARHVPADVPPDVPPDVVVGRIGRAHGLSGHVIVHPETDNPHRFRTGATLDADGRALTVVSSTAVESELRVRFADVDDRSAAEALRGLVLRVPEHERRPLGPGEYWPEDLVGLRVLDASGIEIGVVIDHVEGVAQDRLVIEGEAGRAEIPFVTELVPEIDLEGGHLRLGPIGGLFTE